MIYNLRIDRNIRKKLCERIEKENTISMGWGGGKEKNLSLLNNNFAKECKTFYGLKTTRIPTNLINLKKLKKDDLLIIPHLPSNGKFVICKVADDFENSYSYIEDVDHHNHRIKISKYWGLDKPLHIYNYTVASWYGKLKWLRLPVLEISKFKDEFYSVIDLIEQGYEIKKSDLDDFLISLHDKIIDYVKMELNKIDSSNSKISFENICKRIIEANGYSIIRRNYYDKKGGDVDFFCMREKGDISPFEQGSIELLVQVKKHQDKTGKKAVEQILQMINENQDGCVMSLADGFSKDAEKLAYDNGIILIDGRKVCELLVKSFIV